MSDAQEIGRRFLVSALPDLADAVKADLRQGYVTSPDDSVEVRVRQCDQACFLAVKSGDGVVRAERETAISAEQFDALWPATEGRRLEKTRWTGRLDNRVCYELDVYAGALAPLLTVEVEFGSELEAAAFVPPDWFGPEVSADKRFRNRSLALSGASLVRELFS